MNRKKIESSVLKIQRWWRYNKLINLILSFLNGTPSFTNTDDYILPSIILLKLYNVNITPLQLKNTILYLIQPEKISFTFNKKIINKVNSFNKKIITSIFLYKFAKNKKNLSNTIQLNIIKLISIIEINNIYLILTELENDLNDLHILTDNYKKICNNNYDIDIINNVLESHMITSDNLLFKYGTIIDYYIYNDIKSLSNTAYLNIYTNTIKNIKHSNPSITFDNPDFIPKIKKYIEVLFSNNLDWFVNVNNNILYNLKYNTLEQKLLSLNNILIMLKNTRYVNKVINKLE